MSLSTVPVLVATDNVDDDSDYEDYPISISSDEIIVNARIEYYWGL